MAEEEEEEEELVSVVSVVARALIAIEIRFPWLLFLLDAAEEEKSARRPPPLPLSRQPEEEDDDDDNFTAPREETEDVCITIIIVIGVSSLYIFSVTIFFCFLQNFWSWKEKRVITRKASKTSRGARARRYFKNRKGRYLFETRRARFEPPRRFLFYRIAFSPVDARDI